MLSITWTFIWNFEKLLAFSSLTPVVGLGVGMEHIPPMRKLQSTAAGIPTVSQDTMVNIQEEARRRKAFSMNMT